MLLTEALEQGLVKEVGMPDRRIPTVISDLFVCGDKVFKRYKHELFFFADLLKFESRKEFFFEDFFWNNTAAPEIYRHLWGIEEKDGEYSLVPPTMGKDFLIEMSRIDDSQLLTKLLLDGKLTEKQVVLFIDALIDVLRILTAERKGHLAHLFNKGLPQIMCEDIQTFNTWMRERETHIKKEDSDALIAILEKALAQEPYFTEATRGLLSAAIDNNSDNLLLLNHKPSFIDIMPPMEIWRVVDEYATIARTIVDIEVLGESKLGEVARERYKKYNRDIPPRAKLVHELRGAGIQWSYRHALGQHDIAERFGNYTKAKMEELEALL